MSYETRPEPTPDSTSKIEDRGSFVERVDSPPPAPKPDTRNLNAKLANPLAGVPHEQLMAEAAIFAGTHGLAEYTETIQKGALVAQDPAAFESLPLLTEDDRVALRREITHKWDQPAMLYYLVVMCSIAAAVQGMDEAVANGANLFFPAQFGIDPGPPGTGMNKNQWLQGLVTSAPYLCCAFIGCWLTDPLNKWLGRRGTIFVSAVFSFATCIWQGVTNSWPHLFVARFFLGIGIGPKSATVPVYSAECAPPLIRGALVMMWQTWTAFGIMFGYLVDVAFEKVPDQSSIHGLNWRLMLGSAGVPAVIVALQVYFCPESPRWYMMKGRYTKAFDSLRRLRHTDLQAARDLYYIHVLLEAEKEVSRSTRHKFLELFTVPRNRRATLASSIVMFMQQFCGVNAIAYYSSNIFVIGGFSQTAALLASFGFGAVNFVFAAPAVWTIDTFGRRNLLLVSFPLMAAMLLMTGFAFWIPESNPAHIGVIALGIYLYSAAYSPGEGPVPFTYSAEAFPLYVRDVGMSLATAILWFFNFVIALTVPALLGAWTSQGTFAWFAGWNIVGFFAALFFVPETKALSLEELDQVFSVPTRTHAAYQARAFGHNVKKYVFRVDVGDMPPLYEHEGAISEKTYAPGGFAA
ncbi:MFS general substrate transporter [Ganoderma sinense ZZ0214-1]|uniref:MFS general substrate transporter n=1 Tax=Ganoderma sinense ZZ0214-1 TaxID=1077348 RepID=A0A2G8RTW5_9APHY|nr:MFS general substrate transporter [Ganoderma sinense ZZ0214-1]